MQDKLSKVRKTKILFQYECIALVKSLPTVYLCMCCVFYFIKNTKNIQNVLVGSRSVRTSERIHEAPERNDDHVAFYVRGYVLLAINKQTFPPSHL